jgi:Na+/melibiose symporter-like transporter
MGQRVETLRKENKKEVLAYFIINGYFVLVIIYLLFLLYLNMTSTICMAYFIWYCDYLLSCRTHPFPLNLFQMALFIVILKEGIPVAVLEIMDPVIWPHDWHSFTYCFADP